MTNTPARGGSSVTARDCTPSINLATLIKLLAEAVPAAQQHPDHPLIRADGGRLFVNTRSALAELHRQPGFSSEFAHGDDKGFVRDLTLPPRDTTARVGGRVLPGSAPSMTKSIEKLHEAVRSALDTGVQNAAYSDLTVPSLEAALSAMAKTLEVSAPDLPDTAMMVPVSFVPPDRRYEERQKDLARVFTAIETVDGSDWLDTLLKGIGSRLRKEGIDPDEVEDIVETIRTQKDRPGSQIRHFLDFLDDEALSRVRLQVTMRLMEAIASQSDKAGFREYVARVVGCYEAFAGGVGTALPLDVSAVFGQQNNSQLGEHVEKVGFYTTLPVWPEWSAQLFENRTEPVHGFKTVREVAYRFRVNGLNPQEGTSAFRTRLQRLWTRMLAAPSDALFVKRAIAELVYLWLVVPISLEQGTKGDLPSEAAELGTRLKADPVGTMRRMHHELEARADVMDDLAGELIGVLRSHSRNVVHAASRQADRFTVSLLKGVVNWEVVESLSSPTTDILVKPERGEDSVAWFSQLVITTATSVQGSLASYGVAVELRERALAATGNGRVVPMARDTVETVLPVRFIPVLRNKELRAVVSAIPDAQMFSTGCGVDIHYSLDALSLNKNHRKEEEEQRRSAMVAAFTVLTYVVLWEIARRVRKTADKPLTMTLVRLQSGGRQSDQEADAGDGNTAVYAVSQALERALSRELPVKLQGMTCNRGRNDWQLRGTLAALLGGQPLAFPMAGSLEQVALVTYVTRPCDQHPEHPDADGYLYVSRTYTARAENGSGTLRLDNMTSRLVESRRDFRSPAVILEEISRLRAAGYQHIMLLSHHFGNRHIGRAAERHAPHGTLEFLDEAARRFPDIHLYPLRRDVFPATRLRKRQGSESGFEVVNFADHQAMYDEMANDVLRSLMPVYTFATLSVVGEEQRPQSGFCTYFFDVEQRLTDIERREQVRQNILGVGGDQGIRHSLISVLRALHFMESEKPSDKTKLLPVLDPFDWVAPKTSAGAGEVDIMRSRRSGNVLLSLPALLAHVTKVLHMEAE